MMKIIITLLLLSSLLFADTFSLKINHFEAKTFNIMESTTINETPYLQIDVNTEYYITFRGMKDGTQVGKTFEIVESYNKGLEYHFICSEGDGSVHSITLDLFKKLIILNNDNDCIQVYYLELIQ